MWLSVRCDRCKAQTPREPHDGTDWLAAFLIAGLTRGWSTYLDGRVRRDACPSCSDAHREPYQEPVQGSLLEDRA